MTAGDMLTIDQEVFALIPGLRVVTVVADAIVAPAGNVAAHWNASWSRVHEHFGFPNPQSHPHIHAWRTAMRSAGASHKEFPTSVEALTRRALKSAEPFFVNPLVDFYNSVSLDFTVPAGGYDLEELVEPILLRVTRTGDTFQALDAPAPMPVPPGEIAYTAGDSVITRQLVWRQSQLGLVTASTRRALFLSEVLPQHSEIAGAVQAALSDGLRTLFAANVHSAVLSNEAPALSRSVA
jgi:DNA/RNA-binding domain of Phe-tRNA-synthetase-like protein